MILFNWRFLVAISWATLGAACAGTLPPAAPVPQKSVLVCDTGLDDSLVKALSAKGRSIHLTPVTKDNKVSECESAALAASSVGDPCLRNQQSCQTPEYVDGKQVSVPASPYDAVLLPDAVARRATTRKVVGYESKGGGPATQGAQGGQGRGGRRQGGAQGSSKVEHTVSSSDDGWSGRLYLFAPRAGQLRAVREFTDVSAASFGALASEELDAQPE